MQPIAIITAHDARPVNDRNDHPVDFRSVRCALVKHLNEQTVQLEGRSRDIYGDLELAVLACPTADIKVPGTLVVAFMNAVLQRRFKSRTDAANKYRISYQVISLGLLDLVRHG